MILNNLHIWDGVAADLHGDFDAMEIKDGRIQRLLRSDAVGDAAGRDMGGLFVIPGLIDAHVHMCLDPEIKDPFEQDQYSVTEQLAKIDEAEEQVTLYKCSD